MTHDITRVVLCLTMVRLCFPCISCCLKLCCLVRSLNTCLQVGPLGVVDGVAVATAVAMAVVVATTLGRQSPAVLVPQVAVCPTWGSCWRRRGVPWAALGPAAPGPAAPGPAAPGLAERRRTTILRPTQRRSEHRCALRIAEVRAKVGDTIFGRRNLARHVCRGIV